MNKIFDKITTYVRENKVQMILSIVLFLFVIPFIISTRYTVFWADDLTDVRHVQEYGHNQLINAFLHTRSMYINWQGYYSSRFLEDFLNPATNQNIKLLRIYSILNILFFLSSLYYVVKGVVLRFCDNKKYSISIYALIVIPLLTYGQYSEIWYWFTGWMTYSFPISCCFLGIGMIISDYSQIKWKSNVRFTISLVMIFIACGGSLQVSAATSYLLLIITIVEIYTLNRRNVKNTNASFSIKYFRRIKYNVKTVLIFTLSVLFSMFNAIAPGNFVRHGAFDENTNVLVKAIYYSFNIQIDNIEKYYHSGESTFIIFSFVMLAVGLFSNRLMNNEECSILIILSALIPVISVFPVVLGYNYDSIRTYYPNRVAFINDLLFIVAANIIFYCLGNVLKNYLKGNNIREILISMILVCIFSILISEKKITEYQPFLVADGVFSGQLRESADGIVNALTEVSESSDEDVFVYYPKEPLWWYAPFTLSDSPSDWINQGIASYYGKNSVVFYRE